MPSPTPPLPDADPAPAAPSDANDSRLLRQLAVQGCAVFLVLSLAWPYFLIRNEPMPWPATAMAIGACALLIATLTRLPWWWRTIHALFAPLAAGFAALAVDPGWYLAAFMILLLVYRGAVGGQIPLYLSNRATAAALAGVIPAAAGLRCIDLGAGIGSVARPLAQTRPDLHVTGVENAPATWLVGYLRTRRLGNCEWRWGDIWRTNLAAYDVVYAFLSPAPMPDLWAKVEREMAPGSLLVSNSFAVPGIDANAIVDVGDARQTRLYCYRVGKPC